MKSHILKGSKNEIAEMVARIDGEIHEAIIFVEDPSANPEVPGKDMFAEMEPFTVQVGGADYSRQSLYSRMEDE